MSDTNRRDKPDQPPSAESGREPPDAPSPTGAHQMNQAAALIRERFCIGR